MKILRRPLNSQPFSSPNSRITPIQLAINNLFNDPFSLNNVDFGHLLQSFSNNHLLLQGKQIHARLILCNFAIDNFLASKLINFYAKTGHISHARKVFDEMPHRNTWCYNAMLLAYSCGDKLQETLKLFSCFIKESNAFVKPDNFTLTCILKVYFSLFSHVNLGKELHCYALRNGFDADLFVVNPLITYYATCDELGMAKNVFDLMSKRDLVSWNAMISGYSHGGRYKDCLKLYKLLLDVENLRPDSVTVASVLQACAQKRDLVQGMEVHKFAIEKNIAGDTLVCNAVIGLHAKCGSLDYARELFEKMSERDEVAYGCLIFGYLAHGRVEEAMNLFRKMECPSLSTWNGVISGLAQNSFYEVVAIDLMKEMQALGFKPNSVTLSSALSALSHFSDLRGSKEVHAYAIRNNLEDNIYVTTGMIDVYGKAGLLQGARRVFDRSRHRTVMIWTAIIAAHATNGDAYHALDRFEEMLSYGTQPDTVTFSAVLTACAYLVDIDKACSILEDMCEKYGIQPVAEHYACVVKALTQLGKESEASEFMSKMPMVFSTKASVLHR